MLTFVTAEVSGNIQETETNAKMRYDQCSTDVTHVRDDTFDFRIDGLCCGRSISILCSKGVWVEKLRAFGALVMKTINKKTCAVK